MMTNAAICAAEKKEQPNKRKRFVKTLILLTAIAAAAIPALWLMTPAFLKTVALGLSLSLYFVLLLFLVLCRVIHSRKIAIRVAAKVGYGLLALMLVFTITLQVLAPSVMFYANFAKEDYDELKKLPAAEEITADTPQGTLSGWLWHNESGAAPLVLYFGGNAENAAQRIHWLVQSPDKLDAFDGYNIAFVDYPGYGKSDGSPNEASFKQYGLAVYDALSAREDVTDVVVLAFSIGTGVANYVSSQRPVKQLILFAPYAQGLDLYNRYIDIFHGPLTALVPYRMESINFAQTIQASPLIIASKDDEIIRFDSSERLSKAYPHGSRLITLGNVGHNQIWRTDSTLQELKKYLTG